MPHLLDGGLFMLAIPSALGARVHVRILVSSQYQHVFLAELRALVTINLRVHIEV